MTQLPESLPLCSNYGSGEKDVRVISAVLYALKTLKDPALMQRVSDAICRVHDHKGMLFIALDPFLFDGASDDDPRIVAGIEKLARGAFEFAWRWVGEECELEFLSPTSTDWRNAWSARRFKSDWQPTSRQRLALMTTVRPGGSEVEDDITPDARRLARFNERLQWE